MDALQKQRLLDADIAVEDALARFMNNEALLLRFLARFGQDPSFAALEQALADGRTEDAFTAAHTLKGVTGNLSMQALYRQTCAMVEALRAGALEEARQKLPALQAQYRLTLTALEGL